MTQIWKGAPVSAHLLATLTPPTAHPSPTQTPPVAHPWATQTPPTLAILRLGEAPDQVSYETGAAKKCAQAGVEVKRVTLPENVSKTQLLAEISKINTDKSIHGCLILRPLPSGELEEAAAQALAPEKDVDGMTPTSMANLLTLGGVGFPPCTPQACIALLDHYGVELRGKRVTVVGRSLVVGKPLALLLLSRDATVTVCHTKTLDLPQRCREADILISAAGKAGLIDENYVKPGQIVLDVGMNVTENGKLAGDVDLDAVNGIAAAVTPVPQGIGAVTTAILCRHVVEAAERSRP